MPRTSRLKVNQMSEILGPNSGLKYILNFFIDFYFLLVTCNQSPEVNIFFPLIHIEYNTALIMIFLY